MTYNKNQSEQAMRNGEEVNYSDSFNQLNLLHEGRISGFDGSDGTFNQTNDVGANSGVTGISGGGNTINVYNYPKELTELLIKLISR